MTAPVTEALRRVQWLPLALLLLLAVVAMGRSLGSEWVHDDVPLIERNAPVHQLSGLWTGFVEPYWPPPQEGGLYRPLARTLHTLEWLAGGGSRTVVQLTSLLLYLTLVALLFGLARQLLPPAPAWVATALFAVHPAHAEVVALGVNQGETIVAIAMLLAVRIWIGARDSGDLALPTFGALAGLELFALGFKEHALVLPALLGAWELIAPVPTARERSRRWGAIAGLLLVGIFWWGARSAVLGTVAGAAPAEGLRGATLGARALTMLGVAGEWVRLLLWPAHLQGDYSPWEIAPWGGWAGEQTAGTIAVVSVALALVLAWRRRPVVAFGIGWTVVALAPVANLLVPTGILLAERSLFLASIGVAIAVAGAIPGSCWEGRPRVGVALVTAVVLVLGVGRSFTRMAVWHDRSTYLGSLATDAPESWRTQMLLGIEAMQAGRRAEGEAQLLAASATWPRSPRPHQMLAFHYRLEGRCEVAVPHLRTALRLLPDDRWTRLPLAACLLDLGRYADARRVALADTAADLNGRALLAAARTADSAALVRAPAHTVRLPPVRGGLTIIGTRP